MDDLEQAENLYVLSAMFGLRLAGFGSIPAIKLKLLEGHAPVSCDAPMLKEGGSNYSFIIYINFRCFNVTVVYNKYQMKYITV